MWIRIALRIRKRFFALAQGEALMRTTLKLVLPLIVSVVVVSFFFAAYQVRTDRRILRNDLSRRARFSRKSLQDNAEPQFDKTRRRTKICSALVDRFGQREHLKASLFTTPMGSRSP